MSLVAELNEHPGLYFVAATLMPLASFLLLLLAGGVRAFRRSSHPMGREEIPPRWPAWVATGAIATAFVLCLVGAIHFLQDHAGHHHDGAHLAAGAEKQGEKNASEQHEDERHHHAHGEATGAAAHDHHAAAGHWSGHVDWARITALGAPERATVLQLGYHIDHLAVIMFLMVTFIATLIHLFSMGYMAEELQPIVEDHQVHTESGHLHRRGRFGRFFMFLSLFCFSMLNLILADNLFQVFVSWELVGVCSYLLVGFYYERRSASNAANKAFITNRVGDAGFVIGLMVLWSYVGTFNFQEVFQHVRAPMQYAGHEAVGLEKSGQIVRAEEVGPAQDGRLLQITDQGSEVLLFPQSGKLDSKKRLVPGQEVTVKADPGKNDFGSMPYWALVVAGLGIFLGCVGKSAQFPLHVWLPDAMEGPTPVSALIHAATMVAAGVYLVGRCFPMFTPEARLVIAYTGGITLFMAATIALVMTDIKKVLAYSTVSQLGYMMLALGVGGWVAGLFHLVTHAFFKALLFLCSGSVIYGCHHEQEMTKMGGLYPKMKITALTMLTGVLAIAGIPLFSGWYSKDAILAQSLGFVLVHPEHSLLFVLPLLTAGITTFYMFRMWFMTFTGTPRNAHVYHHAHESPRLMTVPLIILAVMSICVAWGWPVWNAEASALEGTIHHAQPKAVLAEFGFLTDLGDEWDGGPAPRHFEQTERFLAHQYHDLVGLSATGFVLLSLIFAALLYWPRVRVLDPAEAVDQFPGIYRFLQNKWYFDELYRAILMQPALVVARWCSAFDGRAIDGLVNASGRFVTRLSRWEGLIDLRIVDGLVNLTADTFYALGARLRVVQTGYIRSYVLFLALAAVGIFVVLSYFVAMAAAG